MDVNAASYGVGVYWKLRGLSIEDGVRRKMSAAALGLSRKSARSSKAYGIKAFADKLIRYR